MYVYFRVIGYDVKILSFKFLFKCIFFLFLNYFNYIWCVFVFDFKKMVDIVLNYLNV